VYSFILLNLRSPFKLIESENSIKANYISSPIHIVPEWYFLYVYAVLRSIPNKIGGVFALCVTILLLFMVVLLQINWGNRNVKRYSFGFFLFAATIFILTWLGSQPVEWPYIELGIISAIAYLIFFIYKWDFMRKAWSFIFG
jgi:ubiquinol-cytochrome c reductase cytochrome b subunit